ncbi:RimK family alpha-L-glutamate ligase [Methylocystis bryophila]|uniref:RimK family alpha-L-glutamate ligase n=1 Tax=Methylocystis bryophila TaxID=655015 RepID=UPI001FD9E26F|nr:RimK family alpha-L-glutamate ligase [Methylocystis bryophila]
MTEELHRLQDESASLNAGAAQREATERAPSPRVALFTDKIDWHVEAFARALRRFGATAVPVRLSSCKIDTTRPQGLAIPGFHKSLPDLAVVRAIGDGSLEEITMRLGVLHALQASGLPVVNDARAIERCTDKSMASFLLARAGLETPATFVVQSLREARAIAARECAKGPLVLKPLFGAQGWGLRLIRDASELPEPYEARFVYYLQRFVAPPAGASGFEDMRVLVSRGQVVGAMRRRATSWITNVRQGAKPVAATPSLEEKRIALAAARALGADCAGVDLILNETGAPLVLEVNSMAGWSGLQRVTNFSIAERLARDALAAITPAGSVLS